MIQITVAEVFAMETDRDPVTGQRCEVTGASRDRYSLTDQPSITVTGYPNALNKFCRLLMKHGLSGPAEIRDRDSNLRFTITSIEHLAQRDLRDHDTKGLSVERHRPYVGIADAA